MALLPFGGSMFDPLGTLMDPFAVGPFSSFGDIFPSGTTGGTMATTGRRGMDLHPVDIEEARRVKRLCDLCCYELLLETPQSSFHVTNFIHHHLAARVFTVLHTYVRHLHSSTPAVKPPTTRAPGHTTQGQAMQLPCIHNSVTLERNNHMSAN